MTATSPPHVQVFVLAHNRPQLLRDTLHSILSQDCKEFELIVSDNSTNNEVKDLIASEFANSLHYRKRTPPLTPICHFQKALQEADGDYLVLFHDDDLMLPSFIRVMRGFLDQSEILSAVASNAYLHLNGSSTKRIFYPGAKETYLIANGTDMANHYLDMGKFRMPFPGYMYRTSTLKGITLDPAEGGKHADVSFLTKVAASAPVAWLGQPLFQYRIHSGNDSWSENVTARLSLLRFIYRTTTIKRDSINVKTYKLAYWFLWWRSGGGLNTPWRRKVVFHFLLLHGLSLPLRQPRLIFNLLRHRFYYIF